MTVKEQLYEIADELSFNASIEDATDNLLLLYKIEVGLKEKLFLTAKLNSRLK